MIVFCLTSTYAQKRVCRNKRCTFIFFKGTTFLSSLAIISRENGRWHLAFHRLIKESQNKRGAK